MSAEGYHLYVVSQGANSIRPTRRFALPGLPACLTGWAFTAWTQDRINNFAASASGQWIAAAGNLGLAVWTPSGELQWSQDWSQTQRRSPRLAALGDATLLSGEGVTVTAYAAADGKRVWEHKLAVTGEILGLHAGADGRTLAVRTSSDGGRVFVVRDGQTIAELITPADDLSLSPDGTQLAVTTGQQLKWYAVDSGLRWTFSGDNVLHFPRIAPDGRRVAVASQLGSLYVLDADGGTLHDRDTQAIAVPAWLPDGDLLLAGWMGRVERLDGQYQTRWSKLIRSVVPALRDGTGGQPFQAVRDGSEKGTGTDRPDRSQSLVLSAPAALPTSRITAWFTIAANEPSAGPNLLEPNKFILRLLLGDYRATPQNPENSLADGSREALAQTWLTWLDHGMIESGWRGEFALEVDAFNRQLHVEAITLVEDAAHRESWLRDARLQYWHAAAERWVPADYLVSDSAVHTHRLARPIEAARFRLVKSDGHAWPAGNVRLAELILHGQLAGRVASGCGCEAARRRPVRRECGVDQGQLRARPQPRFEIRRRTGRLLRRQLHPLGQKQPRRALWQPPFGHMVPNWRFEIVERPEPGQYRYVEFAWKALSPETKGITLQLAEAHHGGVAICAGQSTVFPGACCTKRPTPRRASGKPSAWTFGKCCPKTSASRGPSARWPWVPPAAPPRSTACGWGGVKRISGIEAARLGTALQEGIGRQ